MMKKLCKDPNLFFLKVDRNLLSPLMGCACTLMFLGHCAGALFLASVILSFGTIFLAYRKIHHKNEIYEDFNIYFFSALALVLIFAGLRARNLRFIKSSHPELLVALLADRSLDVASKFIWDVMSYQNIHIATPICGTKKSYGIHELATELGAVNTLKLIKTLREHCVNAFFETLFNLTSPRKLQGKIIAALPQDVIAEVIKYLSIDDIKLDDPNADIERIQSWQNKNIKAEVKKAYPTTNEILLGYKQYVRQFHSNSVPSYILDLDVESQALRTPLLSM